MRGRRVFAWVAVGGLVLILSSCGKMGFEGGEKTACLSPSIGTPNILSQTPIDKPVGVAAGNSGIGIAWVEDPTAAGTQSKEVWFATLDPDGTEKGSAVLVSPDDGHYSDYPAVGMHADTVAVAWMDQRDGNTAVFLKTVSAGVPGEEVRLSAPGDNTNNWIPAFASDDDGLAVAWHDAHEVYFAALDGTGKIQGEVVQLTNDPWMLEPPSMASGLGSFAVVWKDERDDEDIWFARVTRSGEKLVKPVEVAPAPGNSYDATICFNGENFGVLWTDLRDGLERLYLTEVDGQGAIAYGPVVLAVGKSPEKAKLTWLGDNYGVTFLDNGRLYYVPVSRDGDLLAPEMLMSTSSGTILRYFNSWRNGEFWIAAIEELFEEDLVDGGWSLQEPVLTTRKVECLP